MRYVVADQFASYYRFVRCLHKRKVCVFGLLIPSATCSYVVYISATIVPGEGLLGICVNFHCRHCTTMVVADQFASSYPLCALIAQTEGLRFWSPHSLSFLLICSLH